MRHVAALALVATGCTGSPAQDLPSSHRVEARMHVARHAQERVVLVVDDTHAPGAAALRDAVVGGIETALAHRLEGDPALWEPLDLQVSFGFPSNPQAGRLASATPATSLVTERLRQVEIEALANGVGARLAARSAEANGPYELLATVEEAAVAMKDAPGHVTLVAATAADDEGGFAPGSYTLPPVAFDRHRLQLIAPGLSYGPCSDFDVAPPRLLAWAETVWTSSWLVQPTPWPCEHAAPLTVPEHGHHHGAGSWCNNKPVRVEPAGRATCRVIVEESACDSALGWRLAEDGRCEVPQLDGDALAACRDTLACAGCGDGWCVRHAIEGLHDWCSVGQHPARIRFTGRVLQAQRASLRIVCELQD